MSIQINVVIWTVINFCLLMLVLNFMLFKPLLSFMDKRKEKTEAFKQKQTEREKLREEEFQRAESEKEARRIEYKQRLAETLKNEKQRINAASEAANAEYEKNILLEQENIGAECNDIEKQIDESIDELAKAFAERLMTVR